MADPREVMLHVRAVLSLYRTPHIRAQMFPLKETLILLALWSLISLRYAAITPHALYSHVTPQRISLLLPRVEESGRPRCASSTESHQPPSPTPPDTCYQACATCACEPLTTLDKLFVMFFQTLSLRNAGISVINWANCETGHLTWVVFVMVRPSLGGGRTLSRRRSTSRAIRSF